MAALPVPELAHHHGALLFTCIQAELVHKDKLRFDRRSCEGLFFLAQGSVLGSANLLI